MAAKKHFDKVVVRLKSILKPMFLGAVGKGKGYVSFYLMPFYQWPELVIDLSRELETHKQGDSCLSFRTIDDQHINELAKLTEMSVTQDKKLGYI